MPLDAAAILARLDAIEAAVAELRALVVAGMPTPSANGTDEADDFAPEHLLEVSTAVERFNRPADSIRWMCRERGCGRKIAGRWMASERRLTRYLNGG